MASWPVSEEEPIAARLRGPASCANIVATMKMKALNHLNIVASNVEASASFYQNLFGMERQWSEGDFVFFSCGDTDFALVRGEPLFHRRFHFGFRVETREEVDRWLAAVRAYGAPITHGPKDYGEYYTFTCCDPDGYAIEIYYEEGTRGRTGAPKA